MQDVRVRIAMAVVTILALFGGGASLLAARRPAPPPIVITQPASVSASPVTAAPAPPMGSPAAAPPPAPAPEPKYYVHVAGAVKNPSLYLLPAGSRVMQAIKAAGGPTAEADLDSVNLAEKVKDGEKVYVPNKATPAQTAMLVPPGNSLGHDSADAASTPAGPPPAPVTATPAKVAKGSGAGKAAKLSSPSQGQVDINTASADQLQRLPGIGPAMAARVLAYRQQAGGFQKIEELQEISGIGPKKYAKIAPLVRLD